MRIDLITGYFAKCLKFEEEISIVSEGTYLNLNRCEPMV